MINKIRTLKKKFVFIVPFIFMLSIESFSETDTTEGDTRLVSQEKRIKEEGRTQRDKKNDYNNYQNESDEEEECNFRECVIREFFNLIFAEPIKSFFRPGMPVDDFSEKKCKWGFGASFLDFSIYPHASFSYAIKLNGDFLIIPNEYITFREHIGAHLSPLGGFQSDFERDVYVNNVKIGVEKDKGYSYNNYSFPLSTEIMFKPAGAKGSFFFLSGIGPEYVYEKFDGWREYSYQTSKEKLKIEAGAWIPTVTFGIGKLIDIGKPYCSFEIRYSLGMNQNSKKNSLPGDNTTFVHGFTVLQYQFFF